MIELRYSGGAANADPAASLGGTISSEEISSQVVAFVSGQELAGVTIIKGYGNQEDAVGGASLKLAIESGIKYLIFCPYGITPDTRQVPNYENVVTVIGDGEYSLSWFSNLAKASIQVSVVAANLPAVEQTSLMTASKAFEGFFDSTTSAEAIAGDFEYRCFYVKNEYASSKVVSIYFSQQPSSGEGIGVGIDPIGVNGTAQVVGSENTAPTGVTFSNPRFVEDGLTYTIPAGQHLPVWVRRAILPYQVTTVIRDSFSLTAEATDP